MSVIAVDGMGGDDAPGVVVEGAIEAGTMFAGTPDQVFQQFKKHYEHVGGYGHLLIMGQAGFLEHEIDAWLEQQAAQRDKSEGVK